MACRLALILVLVLAFVCALVAPGAGNAVCTAESGGVCSAQVEREVASENNQDIGRSGENEVKNERGDVGGKGDQSDDLEEVLNDVAEKEDVPQDASGKEEVLKDAGGEPATAALAAEEIRQLKKRVRFLEEQLAHLQPQVSRLRKNGQGGDVGFAWKQMRERAAGRAAQGWHAFAKDASDNSARLFVQVGELWEESGWSSYVSDYNLGERITEDLKGGMSDAKEQAARVLVNLYESVRGSKWWARMREEMDLQLLRGKTLNLVRRAQRGMTRKRLKRYWQRARKHVVPWLKIAASIMRYWGDRASLFWHDVVVELSLQGLTSARDASERAYESIPPWDKVRDSIVVAVHTWLIPFARKVSSACSDFAVYLFQSGRRAAYACVQLANVGAVALLKRAFSALTDMSWVALSLTALVAAIWVTILAQALGLWPILRLVGVVLFSITSSLYRVVAGRLRSGKDVQVSAKKRRSMGDSPAANGVARTNSCGLDAAESDVPIYTTRGGCDSAGRQTSRKLRVVYEDPRESFETAQSGPEVVDLTDE